MAKAKKKLLPKDFKEQLAASDISALKAVFDSCDLNARGGYSKQTALAFDECPDELARWLVEQGADLEAPDVYGKTPLHSRARSHFGRIEALLELGADVNRMAKSGTPLHQASESHNLRHARLLVSHGADVNRTNDAGLTPLEVALRSTVHKEVMADLAAFLLESGARKTSLMKEFITLAGQNFEFHRTAYNPESVDAVSDSMDRLYALFDVEPVPRRAMHDGKTPIVAKAATWEDRHDELWELLVPSSGAAETVQGEVIRISGRIINELEGNGGVNWRADYRKMAEAFGELVRKGKPLSQTELADADKIIAEAKSKNGDNTRRLAELAVLWVAGNPKPIKLGRPAYQI